MLGPVTLECNWLIITVDTGIFNIIVNSRLLQRRCYQILEAVHLRRVLKSRIPVKERNFKLLSSKGIKVTLELWSEISSSKVLKLTLKMNSYLGKIA